MNSDTSTKFWFFAFAVIVGIGAMFWPEITEKWQTSVGSGHGNGAVASLLPIEDTDHIVGFRLGTAAEGNVAPSLENFQIRRLSNEQALLRFELVSTVTTPLYPSIRVYFHDANNRETRQLDFKSEQYAHGQQLSRETIELKVNVLEGEAGFRAVAYYPLP